MDEPIDITDDDILDDAEPDPWPILATIINLDELVDEVALASRESVHAKVAYGLLRQASGDTIPTLEGQLRLIDARLRP